MKPVKKHRNKSRGHTPAYKLRVLVLNAKGSAQSCLEEKSFLSEGVRAPKAIFISSQKECLLLKQQSGGWTCLEQKTEFLSSSYIKKDGKVFLVFLFRSIISQKWTSLKLTFQHDELFLYSQ